MTNLYTSTLVDPVDNVVDLQVTEIPLASIAQAQLTVFKYSAEEVYISDIVPPTAYLENDDGSNTHIRVYFGEGQVDAGEKIKVEIDS